MYDSFRHFHSEADLQRAVDLLEPLNTAPVESDQAEVVRLLGNIYRAQFLETSNRSDIDRAVALHEKLRSLPMSPVNERPFWILSELGETLRCRFDGFGSRDDLEVSIGLLREGLSLCPEDSVEKAALLDSFSTAKFSEYSQNGETAALEESVAAARQSLALRPPGHRDRYLTLHRLGTNLVAAYHSSSDISTVNEAIYLLTSALELLDRQSRTTLRVINALGVALIARFNFDNTTSDIDRAVSLYREALEICPRSAQIRPALLTNMGHALTHRLARFGDIEDLEEDLQLKRECLEHVQPGHPKRMTCISNLVVSLRLRYDYYHDLKSLDEAIAASWELLECLTGNGPDHAQFFNNISHLHVERYRNTETISDLINSMTIMEQCMTKVINNDHRLHDYHQHFGALLILLFERTQDKSALEDAIVHLQTGLSTCPAEHSAQPHVLQALAEAHLRRHSSQCNPEDVEQALQLCLRALPKISPDYAIYSDVLSTLALCHLEYNCPCYSLTRALHYLDGLFRTDSMTRNRFENIVRVLERIAQHIHRFDATQTNLLEIMQIYTRAMDALPRIAFLGLGHPARLRILRQTETLARHAAQHALMIGRPESALELLEQGRALFWSQFLRLRSDFDMVGEELSKALQNISNQLQGGNSSLRCLANSDEHDRGSIEAFAAEQRKLGLEFENLIVKARQTPGCERFLLPETFGSLSQVAKTSSVVIFIAGNEGSHALLLREGSQGVRSINLPRMSTKRLEELAKQARSTSHLERDLARGGSRALQVKLAGKPVATSMQVFYELWREIMKPVVLALDLKVPSIHLTRYKFSHFIVCLQEGPPELRPRLHICATGAFSHLPLHAAGTFNKTKAEGLYTYAIPSYTPTLGVLLKARQRLKPLVKKDARALLAAVPQGFRWDKLIHAEAELQVIRDALPSTAILPLDTDKSVKPHASENGVNAAQVLAELPHAAVMHLACHGFQNASNPLQSGFVMSDQMLTVEELMALDLPNALFAFLSACDTAKGDEQQPDQAIHLASTMLFVGFKSVIGTMWYASKSTMLRVPSSCSCNSGQWMM